MCSLRALTMCALINFHSKKKLFIWKRTAYRISKRKLNFTDSMEMPSVESHTKIMLFDIKIKIWTINSEISTIFCKFIKYQSGQCANMATYIIFDNIIEKKLQNTLIQIN